MAPSVAQKYPVPGIWALGVITISHGNPTAITTNVGSQKQGMGGTDSTIPSSRPFSSLVAQLIFSNPSSQHDVFVNYGSFAGLDANATVLVVPTGQTLSLPAGAPLVAGQIDVNSYYVDGTDGEKIVVTAVYAD